VPDTGVPEPAPEPAAVATIEPVGALDLALVQELWPAVLQGVAERNQYVAGCLGEAHPVAATGRDVTLAFAPDQGFQRRKAESAEGRELLTQSCLALTGVTPVLRVETREPEQLGATAEPEILGEDALIARLRTEFDAVDHEVDEPSAPEAQEGPA
jgi:DNA polymerase-3 subunit gamma/tau